MGAMRDVALALLLCSLALAQDSGVEVPLKSPLAQRKRDEAAEAGKRGRDVHEEVRKGTKVEPEALRKAIADLEEAIDLYERAQQMEWSSEANRNEAECVRSWAALRALTPPEEPPADPDARSDWEKKRERAQKEKQRDARRFVTDVLRLRRPQKIFDRCDRCDGRGELRSAFGDASVCPTCRGQKRMADRKKVLEAYWLAYTPFYRQESRERTRVDSVLRQGVQAEKRLAPFIASSSVSSKVEDHGWWFKVSATEKIIEEEGQRKPEEREQVYVAMNVGRTWWLYSGRVDKDLLGESELGEG